MAGCLIGTAIGDALGTPSSGLSPYVVSLKFQKIDGFYGSPLREPGQYTAVTCRAIATAASISKSGKFDRDTFLKAHVDFMGRNSLKWTRDDGESRLAGGEPLEKCSSETLSPSFLTRAVPIGMAFSIRDNCDKEMSDSVKTATMLTSSLKVASLCGFVVAKAVREIVRDGQLLTKRSEAYDTGSSFLSRLQSLCMKYESKWENGENSDSLWKRLLSTRRALQSDMSTEAFVGTYGNGNSCLEALPFSLFCFLSGPDDFESVFQAATMGGAAAINAAVVGAFVGACVGAASIPERLKGSVEHMAQMATLAEKMLSAVEKAVPTS
jgi:ADP-ribosylglycohydrolase